MKVLVTGAFGHVGRYTLDELLTRGHTVRALDLPARSGIRASARYRERVEISWGDVRNPADLAQAVNGQDAVVHAAFVLPPASENRPEWARAVNVEGSRHLIAAMEVLQPPPWLLFLSSYSVHGDTLYDEGLLSPASPLQPLNHYNRHKVAVEELVRTSRLRWCILRLGSALAADLQRGFDPVLFDLPWHARQEFVHPADVAFAIAQCLVTPAAWGTVWMIGGGPGCQLSYGEMINRMLGAVGIGPLPARAFSPVARQGGGWMDTAAGEQLLHYQHHTFADYLHEFSARVGCRRHLFRFLNPLICWYMVRQSPYR